MCYNFAYILKKVWQNEKNKQNYNMYTNNVYGAVSVFLCGA